MPDSPFVRVLDIDYEKGVTCEDRAVSQQFGISIRIVRQFDAEQDREDALRRDALTLSKFRFICGAPDA